MRGVTSHARGKTKRSAHDAGALELVETGRADEIEYEVDIFRPVAFHQPDEDRLVPFDERGDAEHGPVVDRFGVFGGERLERLAVPRLGGDGVSVESDRRHRLAEVLLFLQLLAADVAYLEQRAVGIEEPLGERVAYGDAVQQRHDATGPL